ncbi:MAG: hypothetical protein JJE04_04560 [Acidobacteriia bacterium]|nr:hypothetical protein [Terriglobia bacterium]
MPVQTDLARLSVNQFRDRIGSGMLPLSSHFSYFVASVPLGEEELRDYLGDPIAALPPSLIQLLPNVSLILAPFLEKTNGKVKSGGADLICFERPAEGKALRSLLWLQRDNAVAAFGIQDIPMADYHHELFHQLASLTGQVYKDKALVTFHEVLREELIQRVHGEVDENSWQHKQALMCRPASAKRDSKAFVEYARDSFVDTLTLYLHGLCCDIDVEPGPRQLPSKYLRRRLHTLKQMFPPPAGYALFPEDREPEKDA